MRGSRVKVGFFVHLYAWAFVLALSLWPLVPPLLLARHSAVPVNAWLVAIGLIVFIQALFWYVQYRCSSEALSYWEGLLVVTASMMTGWVYSSLIVALPVLAFTFAASFLFAVYAEVRRVPGEAAERFHKLVSRLYRNRMVQR
jgi:hypothetical protein